MLEKIAGTILVVLGGPAVFAGALGLYAATRPVLGDAGDPGGTAVAGLVIGGLGLAYLASGVGILRSRGWARVSGSAIGVAGALLFALFAMTASTPESRSYGVGAVAVHVAVAIGLTRRWTHPAEEPRG